jgi:hypothetical protein
MSGSAAEARDRMEASGHDRKGPGSSQEAVSAGPGKVFHDESMYGIFRVERDRHGQAAWHVRLSRGGRTIQTTFSDATYGGYVPALTVARAYRDAVLKVVPPLTNRNMRMLVRKNRPNGSDIPGVYYKAADATHSAYWTARIDVPVPGRVGANGRRKRKQIVRSFNIAKHGYEQARQLAEEERMRMLLAVENGEDPALRNPAAAELHNKLASGTEFEQGG